MNVQNLWSRNNIRGAGQWIAVLDTGVDRWHPFFAGKYIGEACFGTNDPNYESLCPGQDAAGDSSPGIVGSGTPCGGRLNGDIASYFKCRHGTNVAGIAGGRNGRYGMNGVAPDVNFFFINVFSSNRANRGDICSFPEDQLRALQVIRDLAPSFQQITVNMSLGGERSATPCDYMSPSYANVVASLKSVYSIPTIASTGNDGSRDGLNFPACISNVIKVAASNKYNGALWSGSNTANPAMFGANPYIGPIFVAPGGDENIQTSRPGNMYESFGGTSAAAPHVAGVYALVKSVFPGISVDSITSYINDQASVPISIPTPAGMPSYTLRRVVLPTY
jgi:subtilisin family serine protease